MVACARAVDLCARGRRADRGDRTAALQRISAHTRRLVPTRDTDGVTLLRRQGVPGYIMDT